MKKLLQYLTLGVIVSPFPYNIANGQAEDATPVMANFNWLLSQVNGNAASASALASLTATVAALQPTSAAYTPAWTTTGAAPVIGNGSLTGFWAKMGNLLFVNINALFGTTTTFGTNAWRFSVPLASAGPIFSITSASYDLSTGTGHQTVYATIGAGATFANVISPGGVQISQATGAWGNGGVVLISGVYQVAP